MQPVPKIKILLVDDRLENIISLGAVLENPDYELVSATSGREALRCLLEHDFALILLDVQMPEMDGFETASLIKQRARSKEIPIIFVTALSRDEPFVFKGYTAGAVDYILKPFNPHILRSKVAVFAELHRKNLQIIAQTAKLQEAEKIKQDRTIARLELESLRREQHAHEKYRDLVDGINHGLVWIGDPITFELQFGNEAQAEKLLGFSREEWNQGPQFWSKHSHSADREKILNEFRKALITEREFSLEHRFIKADGEIIWFHTGVRVAKKHLPHDAEPGSESGKGGIEFRGLSVDVTHLKNAEEAARKALQVRDDFISIASHELKTPLTPLKLQLQTFRRIMGKPLSQEALQERLVKIVDSSDKQIGRLSRLIEDLLDVARINNGKLILEREPFFLADLVRDVLNRFKEELSQAGCEVELSLDNFVSGDWDKLRMEQVFINIVKNAAKYGAGRPISIEVFNDGGLGCLRIRDQGIGISPADQPRIFSRFERTSEATHFDGLGLGLYIVKQIIDAHGGEVRVESNPGEGSCFTVSLPMGQRRESGLTTETSPIAFRNVL